MRSVCVCMCVCDWLNVCARGSMWQLSVCVLARNPTATSTPNNDSDSFASASALCPLLLLLQLAVRDSHPRLGHRCETLLVPQPRGYPAPSPLFPSLPLPELSLS